MLEKYKKVFDENGNVKACGREACRDLIAACEQLHPNIDFGNKNTGVMNVENIKKLFS